VLFWSLDNLAPLVSIQGVRCNIFDCEHIDEVRGLVLKHFQQINLKHDGVFLICP
jgi:hypothetical protein